MLDNVVCQYADCLTITFQPACQLLKIEAKFRISAHSVKFRGGMSKMAE